MATEQIRVLSMNQVAKLLGVHVSTLHRWTKLGSFVPKVYLSPRRVGFLEADVSAWVNERRPA